MAYFPFFFLNDPRPTEIYPLSLPDALPTSAAVTEGIEPQRSEQRQHDRLRQGDRRRRSGSDRLDREPRFEPRSEEHTSELQSRLHLVCRLLLEKKKKDHKEKKRTDTDILNF